jgi:hypothetical protein
LPVILRNGGVGERLKPAVLKTVRPERVSGVRIPPPPPVSLNFCLCSLNCAANLEFAANATLAESFVRPDEAKKAQPLVKEKGRFILIDSRYDNPLRALIGPEYPDSAQSSAERCIALFA